MLRTVAEGLEEAKVYSGKALTVVHGHSGTLRSSSNEVEGTEDTQTVFVLSFLNKGRLALSTGPHTAGVEGAWAEVSSGALSGSWGCGRL